MTANQPSREPSNIERSLPRVERPVESIEFDALTEAHFREHHANEGVGRPLHIKSNPHLLELHAKWTPGYIKERIGTATISVDISDDGTFAGGKDQADGTHRRWVDMSVSECIDRLTAPPENKENPKERCYVYGVNAAPFGALFEDYRPQTFLVPDGSRIMNTQFWLGGRGNVTPAHFDVADNFLMQVRGLKKVLLWDPSHYPHMYVNPIGTKNDRQSRIGELTPENIARFPNFAHARAQSCELAPGDTIFIPTGWFHYVETTEFAISINHFWHPPSLGPFLDASHSMLVKEMRPELLALLTCLIAERLHLPFSKPLEEALPLHRQNSPDRSGRGR